MFNNTCSPNAWGKKLYFDTNMEKHHIFSRMVNRNWAIICSDYGNIEDESKIARAGKIPGLSIHHSRRSQQKYTYICIYAHKQLKFVEQYFRFRVYAFLCINSSQFWIETKAVETIKLWLQSDSNEWKTNQLKWKTTYWRLTHWL